MFNWLPVFVGKQNLLLFLQRRWQPRTNYNLQGLRRSRQTAVYTGVDEWPRTNDEVDDFDGVGSKHSVRFSFTAAICAAQRPVDIHVHATGVRAVAVP